jgi:hypothetical protein
LRLVFLGDHGLDSLRLPLIFQGRILKHGGDAVAAAAFANEARTMDLADRFLNSESIKRMLQADQVLLGYAALLLFLSYVEDASFDTFYLLA